MDGGIFEMGYDFRLEYEPLPQLIKTRPLSGVITQITQFDLSEMWTKANRDFYESRNKPVINIDNLSKRVVIRPITQFNLDDMFLETMIGLSSLPQY